MSGARPLEVHLEYLWPRESDPVPQSGVADRKIPPVAADVRDADPLVQVIFLGWANGVGKVWGEVEETIGEDFVGKIVDQTGAVYLCPKPGRDVQKKPFGEPKLKYCKKTGEDNPLLYRTWSEYSFP